MSGHELVLKGVSKWYGNTRAVDGIDLSASPGSLVTLLGPSGCGKTSLLRIIAGLSSASAGSVVLGGRDLTEVVASRRNIGVVFQNYALFPHMTVAENVAFGLRARGLAKETIPSRVNATLTLVHLVELAERYPAQLSGGQQQRAALARALVVEPHLLLLDEPLSALDKNLRQSVQQELRKLQKQVGITTVVVTHDQDEAFMLSDEIVVMNAGKIIQTGRPEDVYDRPLSRFVAEFLGEGNLLPGRIGQRSGSKIQVTYGVDTVTIEDATASPGTDTSIFFRPEKVQLVDETTSIQPGLNITGMISDIRSFGGRLEVRFEAKDQSIVTMHVPRRETNSFMIGQQLTTFVKAEDLICLAS